MKPIPPLLLIVLVLQVNGCHETSVFPPIADTTEIVVEDVFAGGRPIKRITDPEKVSRIIAFVNSHEDGWRSPWHDVPIPKIRIVFYQKERKLATLSIGADFFSSGVFLKPASEQEVEQVLMLVEVDKNRFFKP